MKKFIFAFFLLVSVNANAQDCNSLNDLNWLQGEWQTQTQQPLITELWRKLSDKTFEGAGQTSNSDESLRLLEMSGEVFYLAKVPHNPVPIAFKLMNCKNNVFTFKNSQHDFPNIIEYQQINRNALQVEISGESGKSFTIQLYRVKNNATGNKK